MAMQIACYRENDLCENKKGEKDEREGYNTSGGEEERREDKIDKIRQTGRKQPRSIGLYTRCGCGQERAAARLSLGPAERPPVLSLDVTPHYRCHCAATGRIGGLGTGGWVIYLWAPNHAENPVKNKLSAYLLF